MISVTDGILIFSWDILNLQSKKKGFEDLYLLVFKRKSIDACVFTITDDRISNLLVEKFQKGVKVRIITDNDTSNQQGSDITRFKKSGIPCKVDKSPFHMHNKVRNCC
jgi:phosphatidylserine/phosphatidylglycerophosphate/cardiolipin synthase-like enzyme